MTENMELKAIVNQNKNMVDNILCFLYPIEKKMKKPVRAWLNTVLQYDIRRVEYGNDA